MPRTHSANAHWDHVALSRNEPRYLMLQFVVASTESSRARSRCDRHAKRIIFKLNLRKVIDKVDPANIF